MTPLSWQSLLAGLGSKKLKGNVFQVHIQVLGDSEIGPYKELLKFADSCGLYKLPIEVHHIVNGEHLAGTGWEYDTAPCIVLEKTLHQQYHGRFSSVLPDHHGRDIAGAIGRNDALSLYYDMFVDQTGWRELWTIAARILTGSITVPNPSSFWK